MSQHELTHYKLLKLRLLNAKVSKLSKKKAAKFSRSRSHWDPRNRNICNGSCCRKNYNIRHIVFILYVSRWFDGGRTSLSDLIWFVVRFGIVCSAVNWFKTHVVGCGCSAFMCQDRHLDTHPYLFLYCQTSWYGGTIRTFITIALLTLQNNSDNLVCLF